MATLTSLETSFISSLPFPLCSMRSKYDGEKVKVIGSVQGWGEIHQHLNKSKITHILYMNAQRAAKYEVTFNPRLHQWQRNGEPLPEGVYSFGIGSNWKMLACSDADEGTFNSLEKVQRLGKKIIFKHSTVTSGKDVFFAGSFRYQDGRFIWDEKSGHYRCRAIHVAACKAWCKSEGAEDATYVKYVKEESQKDPETLDSPTTSPIISSTSSSIISPMVTSLSLEEIS